MEQTATRVRPMRRSLTDGSLDWHRAAFGVVAVWIELLSTGELLGLGGAGWGGQLVCWSNLVATLSIAVLPPFRR